MKNKIRCVGILTSGGDAPGMNAAIRAVTRACIYHGITVKAIYRGYKGLITGEIVEFKTENVSNIIQRGGTILKTSRCDEFKIEEGRAKAYETLQKEGIDALVVIGGDGSITGAYNLAREYDIPCIALPEQLTTTCTEQTLPSVTTQHSTQSWSVSIKSETQPLRMSVSSLLR